MNIFKASLLSMTVLAGTATASAVHAQAYDIRSVSDSGSLVNSPPENTIDGVIARSSRWASFRDPKELRFDLGETLSVTDIRIAWDRGASITYGFEVAGRASTSGDWTTIFSGTSAGGTNFFENYDVDDFDAREIRIRGIGNNSRGTAYTNITEVEIIGPDEQGAGGEAAQRLDIQSARDSGSLASSPPENVIDGVISRSSRWASLSSPKEVRLDLGTDRTVEDVRIAWDRGTTITYGFEIAGRRGTSGDWTTIFSGTSQGGTNDFEIYDVEDIVARQVRVRGIGNNSRGTPYTNITEVEIFGSEDITVPSEIDLVVTSNANRTGTSALEGAALAGDVFILIDQTDDQNIDSVEFFLDNAFILEEGTAPFDLQSGGSNANPFDTTTLNDGTHSLRADLTFNDGSTESISANFTVDNASGSNNPFGLDPNAEPWENFDLDDWAYDSPAPRPEDECRAIRSDEDEWDEFRDSPSDPYLFTHTDGGMRFVSPVGGATTNTSCNSGFPRSELREMLRRGDTSISTQGVNNNNWALGYQPGNTNHGGRNGVLTATLRVNQVTSTGDGLHPGRTIIGQIHADNDEPARLYYRKLPGATYGCIYLESEIRDGDDVTFNLIGDERCDDNNDDGPTNGIELNELFTYEIINDDEDIIVTIRRGDRDAPIIAQTTVDMNVLESGYDRADEWMYFKAGAYTQNNTGDPDDTDVVTFYVLENSHDDN